MTESGTLKPKIQSLKDIARRVSTIPPTPDGKTSARPRNVLDSMQPVAMSTAAPPEPHTASELADLCEATANKTGTEQSAKPQEQHSRLRNAVPIVGGLAVGIGAIVLSVVIVTRTTQATARPTTTGTPPATATAVETAVNDRTKNTEATSKPAEESAAAERAAKVDETAVGETADKNKLKAVAGHAAKTDGENVANDSAKDTDPKDEGESAKVPKEDERPERLAVVSAVVVGNEGEDPRHKAKESDLKLETSSIPMTPSQGQVQSALAKVRAAARGCVAGMEGPSRATVTFSSSGRVSGVSVSGAASGKPSGSCIRSAVQSARVPPFGESSFTVGITIRP